MNAAASTQQHLRLGLVVGKFSPLHLGHEFLIEEAARQCDRLLILSYCNPEFDNCEAPQRRRWLAARFPQHETVTIDDSWLRLKCSTSGIVFRSIPNNDANDDTQQQFLGWLLKNILRSQPDAFFCSESYGPSCAAVLATALGRDVKAVTVDLDRHHVPVSATRIRRNPHVHRRWMNPEVRAAFVSRIAILGGESSGKTTLAAALAKHLEAVWVPEYGRELWEKQQGVLSEKDLDRIAHEQIRREDEASRQANRYLFCDTSPLTTMGYSLWMFGKVNPELAALALRPYHAIVLCRPDFPFVQDGTRRVETFRLQQHTWYQEKIPTLNCPAFEATGNLSQRIAAVTEWLAALALPPSPGIVGDAYCGSPT
jgi:NadR type nicotinamide-nucleotide adenylyltransferase